MAGDVLDGDVEGAGFDGNAIVSALVGEVCEENVTGIHRVETVGVLDPVVA